MDRVNQVPAAAQHVAITLDRNLKSLTGLRAVAAVAVLLFHFTLNALDHTTHYYFGLRPLFALGYLGVDVFFVLSGFILYHVYAGRFQEKIPPQSYANYISNRVARIYPIHICTMAVMVALYPLFLTTIGRRAGQDAAFSPDALLANLLMVHAWFGYRTPNTPAWSISAEWFAYLLFPLLCQILNTLFIFGTSAVFLLALSLLWSIGGYHPVAQVVSEFVLGMCTYQLCIFRPKVLFGMCIAVLSAISFILAKYYQGDPPLIRTAAALAAVVVIAHLRNQSAYLSLMLSTRVMVYFGEISYSLYMVHAVVWAAVKNVLRLVRPEAADFSSPAVILAGLIASIFVSMVAYRFLELPARRTLRRWLTFPGQSAATTE